VRGVRVIIIKSTSSVSDTHMKENFQKLNQCSTTSSTTSSSRRQQAAAAAAAAGGSRQYLDGWLSRLPPTCGRGG
jgi:hypothetical protein